MTRATLFQSVLHGMPKPTLWQCLRLVITTRLFELIVWITPKKTAVGILIVIGIQDLSSRIVEMERTR